MEKNHKLQLATSLATWFGVGFISKAPGTVGTLAALPFAWIIQFLGGSEALLTGAIIAFLIGCWASAVYAMETGKEDSGEVVIDEVAAIWLVLACFSPSLLHYVVGFFLFRVFDILKPWPVSLADSKVKGGFGVMLDDTLAAAYAIFTIILLEKLSWMIF